MPVEVNYVSIRLFADKLKDWAKFLFRKKVSLLIILIAGSLSGFFIALSSAPSSKGQVTFILTTNGGPSESLSLIASQFGLSFNSDNAFSGENIIELMRSKKVFTKALFSIIPDNGELLINRIGNKEHLFEDWKRDNRLASLIPFTAKDTAAAGVKDSLIRVLNYHVLTHNYSMVRLNRELNYYQITVTSNDEYISNFLPLSIVNTTAQFYSEIKASVAMQNLIMLNNETDSLKKKLNESLLSSLSANEEIYNLNPSRMSEQTNARKNEISTRVLQKVYQAVVENQEVAKIGLQKATPIYQVLDEPRLALQADKPSVLTYTCVGGLLSTFFFIFLLLVWKTLKES